MGINQSFKGRVEWWLYVCLPASFENQHYLLSLISIFSCFSLSFSLLYLKKILPHSFNSFNYEFSFNFFLLLWLWLFIFTLFSFFFSLSFSKFTLFLLPCPFLHFFLFLTIFFFSWVFISWCIKNREKEKKKKKDFITWKSCLIFYLRLFSFLLAQNITCRKF